MAIRWKFHPDLPKNLRALAKMGGGVWEIAECDRNILLAAASEIEEMRRGFADRTPHRLTKLKAK
jgi:hypothetical protein